MNCEIEFIIATTEDIKELINVQNQAFYSDYIKYGYCPGYGRTYESMKACLENRIVYRIIAEGNMVGDIIVRDNKDGNYFLGCLCVIPGYENNGIGQASIKFLEQQFKDALHWSLETPVDKERNYYFYKKCGFQNTKIYMDGPVQIVLFEKSMTD